MKRLFFVSYFLNGMRKWTKFYADSEDQLRKTITQYYPSWDVEYITEW